MFQPLFGLQYVFFLSLDLCWSFLFKDFFCLSYSNTAAQRLGPAHKDTGALCSALTDAI